MIMRKLSLLAAILLALPMIASADQDDGYVANADDAANMEDDDAVGDDDYAQRYYYANQHKGDSYFSTGDDSIVYWNKYAILPQRCIIDPE